MQDVVAAILAIVIFSAVAWLCLWLRKKRREATVEKFPFWRLVFLAVTYGGALWMFLLILAFGQWSVVAPERSALGDLLQIIGDAVGIYSIMLAPIGMIVAAIATAVERSHSIYHRVIYTGCAGYACFLLAIFVLAASRCNIPPGGIP